MKNVMTRAWEIAKEAVVNFGGKVVEYLSGALKMAWAEVKTGGNKMKQESINKLIDMGASRWTEHGHDRLYLNQVAFDLAGIEYDKRKTGSFYYIKFNGEKISNSKGAGIVRGLGSAFIDLKNDKMWTDWEDEFGAYKQLKAKLAEITA